MYTYLVSKGLQRDCDYSLSYIFVYCELNMQELVSIYETCECDIGAPDIHRFMLVDGLSTGPPGFGASQLSIRVRYKNTLDSMRHVFRSCIYYAL